MQARSAVAGDADAVPVAALIDEMIEELADSRCVGETYTDQVKLTVANGAALEDPVGPSNASLEGNTAVPSICTRAMGSMRKFSRH